MKIPRSSAVVQENEFTTNSCSCKHNDEANVIRPCIIYNDNSSINKTLIRNLRRFYNSFQEIFEVPLKST